MPSSITNRFSWSYTRAKTFDHCLRQYYWQYYGYWEGWLSDAPEETRLAYRLKKMVNLPIWTGDIVHRAIKEALGRIAAYQRVSPGEMKHWARMMLNREWRQSTEQRWRKNPKYNLNLFEHYFNKPVSAEEREALRDHVFRCIDNFFESRPFQEACHLGPRRWKPVETLASFPMDEIPVFLQIDFAYERNNGEIVIVDWKSGAKSNHDERQLSCYALYAFQEWQTPVEKIRIVPVYLSDGDAEERRIDPAMMMQMRETIFQSAAAMRERLDDPVDNLAAIDHFPKTEDRWKCDYCQFWEMCHPGPDEGRVSKNEKSN